MTTSDEKHRLWIATVGSASDPLVKSLIYWQPAKVIFLPSEETKSRIAEAILPQAAEGGCTLSLGQVDTVPLPHAENPTSCIQIIVEQVKPKVQEWLARGDDFDVVVDWTGGTKIMSAALALVAHRWRNTYFSYVGGTSRTKSGVGTVEPGSERVRPYDNSWEILGYSVIEDALYAYQHGAYGTGVRRLRSVLGQIDKRNQKLKSELSTLARFLTGIDAWNKCEYKRAKGEYEACARNFNDLKSVLPDDRARALQEHIQWALPYLHEIGNVSGKPSRRLCEDLLANARRRQKEGRLVDAVARLYHAIEALGQVQLGAVWNLDASRSLITDLPLAMQNKITRQDKNGYVQLGLQNVYRVLKALGDPMGTEFQKLGWHEKESPLNRRNLSIAGHGFEPVREKDCNDLWQGALALAQIEESDLPSFPRLGLQA